MDNPFVLLNPWTILAAVLASLLLTVLWYSPLMFGTAWLRQVDRRVEEITREELKMPLFLSLIPTGFSVLAYAVLMVWTGIRSLVPALFLALLLGVGWVAMTLLRLVLFEGYSSRLLLINLGCSVSSLCLSALILTVW